MRAVVTVVGKDRIGIVAGVATALAKEKANILEMSQTLMSGAFTMMMVVEIEKNDFSNFQMKMAKEGEALDVTIHVQNETLFKAVHQL